MVDPSGPRPKYYYHTTKIDQCLYLQIISDHDLKVMLVDATRPVGTHDSHVLGMSYPEQRMEAGEFPEQMSRRVTHSLTLG